jgi:hypothetical protein
MSHMKKLIRIGLPAVIIALVVVQFFGPDTMNPPEDPAATFEAVAHPPKEVAAIIDRSCRDCHTNRTAWPWYSRVAPASVLVARVVKNGRAPLNFSELRGRPPAVTARKMSAAGF